MATITGLTAERMLEIENASVVDGEIVSDHLILSKFDGTTIDAGALPAGPTGPTGPAGGFIPGEVRLWPNSVLPLLATYGKWVWADGGVYVTATYPIAAGHIASAWRTFGGASDPGGSNFRVPDFRGLIPAGMDQMPGGARANRLTRSVSITLAGKTGEETHIITLPEIPSHGHTVTDPGHTHTVGARVSGEFENIVGTGPYAQNGLKTTSSSPTGITIANAGGGGSHENMQPTVFVPYIVKLD